MLSRLSIHNYAIISHLEVDFSNQLNIITGETGAGKSILLGALGLILGQRADSGSLMNREKKCIIEGVFKIELPDGKVTDFLKGAELDVLDELVVRREIAPNGKSRAFVNDTPVNLSQLAQLSNLLVDLHQQFDTMELSESDFQRQVLDALGNALPHVKTYHQLFIQTQEAKKKWAELKSQKEQFTKDFDYYQFQFTELDEAGFRENELEELEVELKLLSNAEGIKTALDKAYFILAETEDPVTRQVKALTNSLQSFNELHPHLPPLVARLQSAYIELADIADEANRIGEHISADASSIEKINDRLSAGYKLFKKHGVKSTAELLQIRAALADKLQAVLHIDEAIEKAAKAYESLLQKAAAAAEKISAIRKAQVKPLEQQVAKMLAQVGMPAARLKIDVQAVPLHAYGSDAIEFLFDANKSGYFQPLRKVASGGELSRLMLCIKSLVARSMNMPTLIFDEIDTGISGEAAKQVGIIMKELADNRQVICITHQPQIAGKANAHYLVYKAIQEDRVTTGVRQLSTDERIVAIAKMMSGEKPTAAALENAREMVMN